MFIQKHVTRHPCKCRYCNKIIETGIDTFGINVRNGYVGHYHVYCVEQALLDTFNYVQRSKYTNQYQILTKVVDLREKSH